MSQEDDKKASKILKAGGIGVMPTDTIYGLVDSALKPDTVARIYQIRKRSPNKPLIILISKLTDLKKFGVKLSPSQKEFLTKNWPGPLSVILPCPNVKFKYLHRGTKTLAFRLPSSRPLRELLASTGPLVAPSANPEGLPPAKTIKQAKDYFGDRIDFYSPGRVKNEPSTLISLVGEKVVVLREGRVKKMINDQFTIFNQLHNDYITKEKPYYVWKLFIRQLAEKIHCKLIIEDW